MWRPINSINVLLLHSFVPRHRFLCFVARQPEVGDVVVLANANLTELKGLLSTAHGTVIKYDSGDPNLCYQVQLKLPVSGDGTLYATTATETPWFSSSDITLKDPTAPIPPPKEPESNACCGSQCPDCVWIQYFAARKAYEARMSAKPSIL